MQFVRQATHFGMCGHTSYINLMHCDVLWQAHKGVEYRSFPDISHLISSYVDVGVNNGLCCALVSPVSPANCHPVTQDDDDDDSSTYFGLNFCAVFRLYICTCFLNLVRTKPGHIRVVSCHIEHQVSSSVMCSAVIVRLADSWIICRHFDTVL